MRPTLIAFTLALLAPAAALAASSPGPSHNVPPPKCSSSVGFPALDASSKDAAKMSVKISPDAHKGRQANIGSQSSGAGAGKVSSHNIGSQSSGAGAGKVHACGGRVMDDEAPKETVH